MERVQYMGDIQFPSFCLPKEYQPASCKDAYWHIAIIIKAENFTALIVTFFHSLFRLLCSIQRPICDKCTC